MVGHSEVGHHAKDFARKTNRFFDAVVVSLKGAPSLTHFISAGDIGDQAGTPAAGSFLLKSYKPTGSGDVTPIAATTPWSAVDWIAIGT